MSNDFFLRYLDEYSYNASLQNDVYHNLPHLLKECTHKMDTTKERELFLLGALGVLSGMMPNVQGNYFGKPLYPNLYCFIIGKYGTGKGGLMWARHLGDALHQQLTEQANNLFKDYSKLQAEYLRQQKLYDKGKLHNPPDEPTPPPHLKLYIPANTTKTAVMQLLKENEGRGIIFETEGDTLADMLRQDYGNFSDILRKAYHHEPISYYRRSNNEDVEINNPALSVVLSGTHDQLLRLVPSVENGLFSRFCFYLLDDNNSFNDPFAEQHSDKLDFFVYAGEQYAKLYNRLKARNTPLKFVLTDAQQKEFLTLFSHYKNGVTEYVTDELSGSVNRLGVICYRLAMIMSTLRAFECDQLQDEVLHCLDKEFTIAKELTATLLQYTLDVYEYIKEHGKGRDQSSITPEQGKEIIRLKKEGYTLRGIAHMVLKDEGKYSSVNRYLKKHF